jgi:hypothetical protein
MNQSIWLGANAVHTFFQVEDGAVVDDPPGLVAPDAVADPARLDLADIARHQPVQVGQGVRPGDQVFDHRRDIENAAGVAT